MHYEKLSRRRSRTSQNKCRFLFRYFACVLALGWPDISLGTLEQAPGKQAVHHHPRTNTLAASFTVLFTFFMPRTFIYSLSRLFTVTGNEISQPSYPPRYRLIVCPSTTHTVEISLAGKARRAVTGILHGQVLSHRCRYSKSLALPSFESPIVCSPQLSAH